MLFCQAHKDKTLNPAVCYFCNELELLRRIAKAEEERATAEYLYEEAKRELERLKNG